MPRGPRRWLLVPPCGLCSHDAAPVFLCDRHQQTLAPHALARASCGYE